MAAIMDLLSKRKNEERESESLLNEIYRISDALELAYERFELQNESDLVEATIFEIEALKARYRYVLGLAKQQNISANGKRL